MWNIFSPTRSINYTEYLFLLTRVLTLRATSFDETLHNIFSHTRSVTLQGIYFPLPECQVRGVHMVVNG